MLVCIHYPHVNDPPVGIWFWDDDLNKISCYYLQDCFTQYLRVKDLFKVNTTKKIWNRWIKRLSERTPVDFNFEIVDIYTEPKKFLINLAKAVESEAGIDLGS